MTNTDVPCLLGLASVNGAQRRSHHRAWMGFATIRTVLVSSVPSRLSIVHDSTDARNTMRFIRIQPARNGTCRLDRMPALLPVDRISSISNGSPPTTKPLRIVSAKPQDGTAHQYLSLGQAGNHTSMRIFRYLTATLCGVGRRKLLSTVSHFSDIWMHR